MAYFKCQTNLFFATFLRDGPYVSRIPIYNVNEIEFTPDTLMKT